MTFILKLKQNLFSKVIRSRTFKGAYPIVWKRFCVKLADMDTFLTKYHPQWKRSKFVSVCKQLQKTMFTLFIALYKMSYPILISMRVFHWFLLNHTHYGHATSHKKPFKYDSTSGTNFSTMFEKSERMRLWVRASAFKWWSRNIIYVHIVYINVAITKLLKTLWML